MSQAVKDFLKRMQAEFPAPTHLRTDAAACEKFLADYERVLAGWPKEVLDAAWPLVLARQEYWIWPRPQQIYDACKEIARSGQQAGRLEQLQEMAHELAERYVRHYQGHSRLVKLAETEGWNAPLMKFIRESAWVQAQLICKIQSVGWDSSLVRHLGDFQNAQEGFDAFMGTIQGATQRGRIEVRVPPSLIREWKSQHVATQDIGGKGKSRTDS